MPKVTLLGSSGRVYTFYYGRQKFSFVSGREVIVPPAIADQLRGKKTSNGKPVFFIEKLPAFAEPELPEALKVLDFPVGSDPQNVSVGQKSRQVRFGSWA
jgi:hypothetical protein